MSGHRTTPRGILFLLSLAALAAALVPVAAAGTGGRAAAPEVEPARMLFPVLGPVRYQDDFGDARAQGGHEGNDILVARWSPVVAVEDGRVKWWTTSARAGCMLYLEGRSGTTYLYIHLNNDRSAGNDNRGGCVAGIAYTVPDGAKVTAGQQIAWSGDSGDADGTPHLHFELHPGGGGAISPFTALNGALRTLFPARRGAKAAVGVRGLVVAATDTTVDVRVRAVRWWPGGRWLDVEPRVVQLVVDAGSEVLPVAPGGLGVRSAGSSLADGEVTVVTRTARVSADAIAGLAGALVVARIRAVD